MEKETDLRRGRHVVFNLHVHLVFMAKYRRKVFTKEVLDDMRGIFESVCTDFEAQLVEFDGENDHVHLLVNYPPKVSISKLVNSSKGVSSLMIRKKITPVFVRNFGVVRCGRRLILLVVAAVRRFLLFGSILSNKIRLTEILVVLGLLRSPCLISPP